MPARRAVFSFVLAMALVAVCAAAAPSVVIFYEEGCPDCQRMEAVLEEILAPYPGLEVARYETTQPGNPDLWWNVAAAYGLTPTEVPMIFVGKEAIVGAGRTAELRLRAAVEACAAAPCPSPLELADRPSFPWMLVLVLGGTLLLIAFALLFL